MLMWHHTTYAAFETPESGSQFDKISSHIEDHYKAQQEIVLPTRSKKVIEFAVSSLANLARERGGLVIGEIHHQLGGKQLLIALMRHLQDEAVLFLEHVYKDEDYQFRSKLKDYTIYKKNMDQDLKAHLARLDLHKEPLPENQRQYDEQWEICNYEKIMTQAQQNSIEVIPIDHSLFYHHSKYKKGKNRYKSLNYFAVTAYETFKTQRHLTFSTPHATVNDRNSKIPIFFVGNAHINYFQEVPGIADQLDLPSLAVYDTGTQPVKEILCDFEIFRNPFSAD